MRLSLQAAAFDLTWHFRGYMAMAFVGWLLMHMWNGVGLVVEQLR